MHTKPLHAFILDGFTFSEACGLADYLRQLIDPYLHGWGDAALRTALQVRALTCSTVRINEQLDAGTIGTFLEQLISLTLQAVGESARYSGAGDVAVMNSQRAAVSLIAKWLRANTSWN
jgi:hypothetical protein